MCVNALLNFNLTQGGDYLWSAYKYSLTPRFSFGSSNTSLQQSPSAVVSAPQTPVDTIVDRPEYWDAAMGENVTVASFSSETLPVCTESNKDDHHSTTAPSPTAPLLVLEKSVAMPLHATTDSDALRVSSHPFHGSVRHSKAHMGPPSVDDKSLSGSAITPQFRILQAEHTTYRIRESIGKG